MNEILGAAGIGRDTSPKDADSLNDERFAGLLMRFQLNDLKIDVDVNVQFALSGVVNRKGTKKKRARSMLTTN